jgi:hypothetical protein
VLGSKGKVLMMNRLEITSLVSKICQEVHSPFPTAECSARYTVHQCKYILLDRDKLIRLSINLPQAAVLGMHTIKEKPVVVKGEIVIRPIMVVALTYDHRLLDGREAVTFLGKLHIPRVDRPGLTRLYSASQGVHRGPKKNAVALACLVAYMSMVYLMSSCRCSGLTMQPKSH